MYLESLELHGFKSFADRTTIKFAPGVTAIVGPNGCGKSNIIDAVRWVIGEQRARILRVERMDNVIFNGAADRRRLGMAEVSMTIENTRHILPTEFSEVKITRRLYRSGDSEYLINDRPCRLKDIQDLFMDTGMGAGAYSVIELKMIEDMLSENAQDRRRLFEEAAGITKYKLRRTQTLRKLDATQADLQRIRDIVDEVGRTVRSLQRQAKKATRHRELTDEFRELSINVASVEFDRLSREKGALDKERGALDDRVQELTAQQAGEDARLEARRTELIDLERDLSESQHELNLHIETIRGLESDARLQDERITSSQLALERTERDRLESESRRILLDQSLEKLAVRREEIRPRLEDATSKLDTCAEERDRLLSVASELRQAVDAARAREDDVHARQADYRQAQSRLSNRIELHEEECERLAGERQALVDGGGAVEERRRENTAALSTASTEVSQREQELRKAEADLLQAQKDIETAQAELHKHERRREGLKAEAALLESLMISQEEAGEAVQFLASDNGWSAAAPATVADLLACDKVHAAAVESALGPYANCLVVNSEKEVDRALAALRDSGKGSAAFIVLDRLSVPDEIESVPGTTPLADLIRVSDKKLNPLVSLLFYDIHVVDDLDVARTKAWEHSANGADHRGARFIAISGEWADAAGRVHGGGAAEDQPSTSRIGRRERLGELHAEIKNLTARGMQQKNRIEQLRSKAEGIAVGNIRMSVRDAEQVRARLDQESTRIDSESGSLGRSISQIDTRLQVVADSLAADRVAVDGAAEELNKLETEVREVAERRSEAEAAFQKGEADARKAEAAFGEANVAAVQVRHEFETVQRDERRATEDLEELDARDESRQAEIESLGERISVAEVRKAECGREIAAGYEHKAGFDQKLREAEAVVNELRGSISDQDVVLREVRRLREAAMQDEGSRMTRLAEISTRLDDIAERTLTDFEFDLGLADLEVDPDFDIPSARTRVADIRDRLRNLGAVNELALESFEEEKERLDFMSTQQQDLERAEKTLVDTIEEINETASARFVSTFEKVQASFSLLFERLFGEGASARVFIEEGADPLEAPINIVARPSGKKNVLISQLSGGEKALTATALLFAIYLVKPSPFCILDEVDAPLDDANVERFMTLLHEFSESTQFILVTHNKLTMEAADRMYGITMEQQGVSKVVAVTFEAADQAADQAAA